MADSAQQLLNDFVFADCRLADLPRVWSVARWAEANMLRIVGVTRQPPPAQITFSLSQGDAATTRSIKERGYLLLKQLSGVAAQISVPVLGYEGRSVGVISFYCPTPGFLQDRHVAAGQLLAALLAYRKLHLDAGVRKPSPVSSALGQALAQIRHELGLTQAVLAARIPASEIAVSRWERGGQCPSPGPLYAWCEALGVLSPKRPTLVAFSDVTPQILDRLQRDPDALRELSPSEFEQFIAGRLDRMGFHVQLTGATTQRDGGIDLIAMPKRLSVGTFLLAGQIKHHSGDRKTGRDAVDRLLSWKGTAFSVGLLVTNTGFSRDALWIAAQDANKGFLRLRDFDDLKNWIADNFWSESEWREIPDVVTLAPGVAVTVPKARLVDSLSIWPIERLD